ncbi:zinc ribbon domain-containing protein [Nitrosarchaeum koreense]|uniref:zinc ribbon domain-containing protein n=1 Tax=Nitrosarchaeum koreense TaxID=1088740 RepID=UPI00064F06D5|nr:zinc ribbon domain-containing protein [Nitrosarchaeum koreense]
MIKISQGIIFIIIGVVLLIPGFIFLNMLLPFPYGLGSALLIGPSFIIVGIIKLSKTKKLDKPISDQTKFCTKCGQKLSSDSQFCIKCGAKSSD